MTRLFLECTLRAALIVAGTAIVLYAMRVKVAAVKHRVWTAVLLLMLALPFWIVWGPKAPVRILPARFENFATEVFIQAPTPAAVSAPKTGSRQTIPAPTERLFSTTEEVVFGLYLFVALILLARLAIGTARARRLVRESSLCPGLSTKTGDNSLRPTTPGIQDNGRIGVRCSDSCAAPVTVGCFRPTIVLPAKWRDWSASRLAVVLAHEREHVRRRDPLVQWLALLNRAVFWFHPAAWWLERELSALAEECCDAAVLAQGHDAEAYAETLMHMARAVMDSARRVNVTGAAMAGLRLPERIGRIVEGVPKAPISRTRALFLIAACAATCAPFVAATLAQSAGATSGSGPAFDVASVKVADPDAPPVASGMRMGFMPLPGGRFVARNVTVAMMISVAYQLKGPDQFSGAPNWAKSRRFDIEAKAADTAGILSKEQWQPMLRSLLAERFKLKAHADTRQLPVYALEMAKPDEKGPGLHPGGTDCGNTPADRGQPDSNAPPGVPCGALRFAPDATGSSASWNFAGHQASMEMLGATLANMKVVDRIVIDRTGLNGAFDFSVDVAPPIMGPGGVPNFGSGPEAATPDPSAPPSIFTVLREQLGLKLEATTGRVQTLVIDHVEEPTAN